MPHRNGPKWPAEHPPVLIKVEAAISLLMDAGGNVGRVSWDISGTAV